MNSNQLDSINKRWKRILHALKKQSKPIMEEYDLTKVDGNILLALHKQSGLTKADLADRLCFKPSSLTRSLDRLISSGMVDRVTNQNDKRYIVLSLSDKGNTIIEKVNKAMREPWKGFLNGLDEDELEVLDRVLGKMIKNLK